MMCANHPAHPVPTWHHVFIIPSSPPQPAAGQSPAVQPSSAQGSQPPAASAVCPASLGGGACEQPSTMQCRSRHWLQGRVKRGGLERELHGLSGANKKSGDHDGLLFYVSKAIRSFGALHNVYGSCTAWQHRFWHHMLQSRQLHRMCEQLALGYTTVEGHGHDRRHRMGCPKAHMRPRMAVVCMGDASAGWGGPIPRQISAPVKKLRDFFFIDNSVAVTAFAVNGVICILCLLINIGAVKPAHVVLTPRAKVKALKLKQCVYA